MIMNKIYGYFNSKNPSFTDIRIRNLIALYKYKFNPKIKGEKIFMNLPNKLTILRVILIPFFMFFILLPDYLKSGYVICDVMAALIFGIASFTDYLDGKIARTQNIVTDFGKFADPLADKILVISAFVCFIALGITGPVLVIIERIATYFSGTKFLPICRKHEAVFFGPILHRLTIDKVLCI